MQEDIKEILDILKTDMIHIRLFKEDRKKLLDYITNLQEELEELREDNYAYHQLMKMENEREYRSKFLKEFQEEFGKNVFPDYDEIYKRYDKLKKENKQLKDLCDKYEEEHSTKFNEWVFDKRENERLTQGVTLLTNELIDMTKEKEDYKSRNEKATEYINHENFKRTILVGVSTKKYTRNILDNVLNILRGVDKE